MNNTQKKLILKNDTTGEISHHDVIEEHNYGPNIRRLSMYTVALLDLLNIQKALGYKKNAMLVLEYILKNVNINNVFKANITEISKILKIPNRTTIRNTLKELNKLGFLIPIDDHIYQVNPFIYISTKVKSKENKINIQKEFETKYKDTMDKLTFKIIEPTEYKTYLKSEKWNNKKQRLFEERKTCALCDSNKYLHLHHLTYKDLYNEKDEQLEVLCGQCHRRLHLATREL